MRDVFAFSFVTSVIAGLAVILAAVPIVAWLLRASGRIDSRLFKEITTRYVSWLWLIPLMLVPIVAGRLAFVVAMFALSILAYREFARATGIFRDRALSLVVVVGIFAEYLAIADHWYDFFMAVPSLAATLLVIVALFRDSPKGFIQRVALSLLAFFLFGVCFGHTAYLANDRNFRSIILLLLLSVEFNDIFAFCVGKALGGPKLAPQTSPGKTWSGSIGAFVLTTSLFAMLGRFVFEGTPLGAWHHLAAMGAIVSIAGQCGDLVLSSVKRDLGLKDLGTSIPGHGGILDRFDSLIFAGPALFHYINYFGVTGVGFDMPRRLFSGS